MHALAAVATTDIKATRAGEARRPAAAGFDCHSPGHKMILDLLFTIGHVMLAALALTLLAALVSLIIRAWREGDTV
jgi:hypothetical protein